MGPQRPISLLLLMIQRQRLAPCHSDSERPEDEKGREAAEFMG